MAEVYDPQVDSKRKDRPAHLFASVRLYREGELLSELPFSAIDAKPIPGENAFARGIVPLDANLEPRDYVMALLITDEPSERKGKPSIQRIDWND